MKRVASFIIAFVFLGSNLGFAVGTHFCGGHAMEAEVMLGHKDLSCGMMPEITPHHEDHPHQVLNTIPCCQNEFQSFQLDEDFDYAIAKTLIQPITTLVRLFVVADFSLSTSSSSVTSYTPPIPQGDVNIHFQVFRI